MRNINIPLVIAISLIFALFRAVKSPVDAALAPQPSAQANQQALGLPGDVITGTDSLDICSQHGPKCPLNATVWPGNAGEWQYTGKKWTWLIHLRPITIIDRLFGSGASPILAITRHT